MRYVCDSYLSLKESFNRGAVTGIDNSDRQVFDKAVVCRVAIQFLAVVEIPFGSRPSFSFLSLFNLLKSDYFSKCIIGDCRGDRLIWRWSSQT